MRSLAHKWAGVASGRVAQWLDLSSAVPLGVQLRWMLRRGLRMLGKPGVLAIGMLCVLPPFYFSAIAPAQQRLEEARRSTLSLREQIQHASKSFDGSRATPAGQLEEFYRIFPEERSAPQWLKKLVELAGKNGLGLQEGEYKATRDKAGRLMRLQMVLPVKGEYRQIRRFLAALAVEIPIVALENVQFTRENVTDSSVEARIRLALFMEQSP
ncbi:MAG: type 4a pilus biogenesis protein PilO [Nitrosomonadales bacterium]|nr:type 4a pilus biogenesis protein PilO [Nitrosomonadales bacterium]